MKEDNEEAINKAAIEQEGAKVWCGDCYLQSRLRCCDPSLETPCAGWKGSASLVII